MADRIRNHFLLLSKVARGYTSSRPASALASFTGSSWTTFHEVRVHRFGWGELGDMGILQAGNSYAQEFLKSLLIISAELFQLPPCSALYLTKMDT